MTDNYLIDIGLEAHVELTTCAKMFCGCAVVAKNHNPIIRELGIRLNKRGLCKMEIIGAAMRKLLHLAYGVLKNDLPFDLNYLAKQIINP